jgi:phage/plasmid-associated DNA primase
MMMQTGTETATEILLPLRAGIQERYYQLSAPTDGDGEGGKTIRVLLGFDRTDMGNAERLIAYYGHDIRYCAELNEWYLWDSTRWVPDTKLYIWELARETVKRIHYEAIVLLEEGEDDAEQKLVNKFAYASQSHARIKAMLQEAQSDPRIAVTADEFDTNPYLLCCKSGTIDYQHCPREKPYREHRREDLITQFTPRNYNPEADGKVWYETLFGALPIKTVFFVQDSFGYSSTHVFQHKMFWYAYGIPDGRKSSVIDPPFRALGDYVGSFEYKTVLKSYEDVGGPRADIIDLGTMRAGQCSELPKNFVINDALIKSVTSANRKRVRGMYKTHGQDVEVKTKLWFESNFPAKIDFEDEANFNRLCVIVFNRKLETIDDTILEFLRTDPESLDAVFTWIVDGGYNWIENGGLRRPAAVDAATRQYQKMMNPLNWFLNEYCTKDDDGKVKASDLFVRFKHIAETMPKDVRETLKDELRGVKSFGKAFKKICEHKPFNDGLYYIGITLPVTWSPSEDDVEDDPYMHEIHDDNEYLYEMHKNSGDSGHFDYQFRKPLKNILTYRGFRKKYSESPLSPLSEAESAESAEGEADVPDEVPKAVSESGFSSDELDSIRRSMRAAVFDLERALERELKQHENGQHYKNAYDVGQAVQSGVVSANESMLNKKGAQVQALEVIAQVWQQVSKEREIEAAVVNMIGGGV